MNDQCLLQALNILVRHTDARAGIFAETLDGSRRVSINAADLFPAASSIKIFVLFSLLKKAESGHLLLSDRIELTAGMGKPGSGVLFHLDAGLAPTLKDLATLMMMISDNTALCLLTDYLGLDEINADIAGLGLENTRIGDWSRFRETHEESYALSTSTPLELASFLMRLYKGEFLSPESRQFFWDRLHIQKYIIGLRRHLPANPWAREFDMPEIVRVASKNGSLGDCTVECGLVRQDDQGWVISIMLEEPRHDGTGNNDVGEHIISDISYRVYQAWKR